MKQKREEAASQNKSAKLMHSTRVVAKNFADITFNNVSLPTPELVPFHEAPQKFLQKDIFKTACKTGDIVKVLYFLDKGNKHLYDGLMSACEGGQDRIVQLLWDMDIKPKQSHPIYSVVNASLSHACRGAHLSTIDWVIERQPTYWACGVIGACEGGHLEIVKLMISKSQGMHEWDWYIRTAAEHGHYDVVKYLLQVGKFCNVHSSIESACYAGKFDIANLILDNIDVNTHFNDRALCSTAEGAGRQRNQSAMDFIQLMISKGATSFDNGLCMACKAGNMDIIKFMLEKGAKKYDMALRDACKGGYADVIELILDLGATNYNVGLYGACVGGHLSTARKMLDLGANDYNTALIGAIERAQPEMAELMINLGANQKSSWLQNTLEYFRGDLMDGFVKLIRLFIKHGAKNAATITSKIKRSYGENTEHYLAFVAAQQEEE
jgi:hypothetical protein